MIRILHHHLRRGGVPRVMGASAEILRDAGREVEIWSGEESSEPLPEGVGFRLVPELRYRDNFSEQGVLELTEILTAAHKDGDLWHIHNFSLGKNPMVTAAVCGLAEIGIPLILQIHDFAEDGRPQNLRLLRDLLPTGTDKLYPVGDHIVYAVLQERDRQVLLGAGIPDSQVGLLPNPIFSGQQVSPPNPAPHRILYLTRAIRRKNIGEFLYWAKALSGHFEFCTSLIPENPKEKRLFDEWTDFCARQQLPVKWGVGLSGNSFEDVVGESDVCITTSVGEGFGMSFLEPYAMDRSVVGRDLPLITNGFKADGVHLDHLYTELPVSVDGLDIDFWPRAVSAVSQWRLGMGVEEAVSQSMLQAYWVNEGCIDFGRLDEPAQRHVLQTISFQKRTPEQLIGSGGAEVCENKQVISTCYNEDAALKRLDELYARLQPASGCEYADASKVRDAFTDVESLSLLRI